jgi:hypothetical protein
MKSFLLKNGVPIIKWGSLKDGILFQGKIPNGYDLAIAPTPGYIIIDVDNKNGKCGSKNVPKELLIEFGSTFNYNTENGGFHYWFKYTGSEKLPNTTSKLSIDLRVGASDGNNGGYAKWHPRDSYGIMDCIDSIKESSVELNEWIEGVFKYVKK